MMRILGIPYTQCFETLSNDLRVEVIHALKENPASVGELSKKLNVEQSRLSHALQVLKDCKYVTAKVKGKERVYSLREEPQNAKGKNVFEVIEKHVSKSCGHECARLGVTLKTEKKK